MYAQLQFIQDTAAEDLRGRWLRTSQVVGQVLDGALAGDDGLHEESEHGEHSQTAVLNLLGLRARTQHLSAQLQITYCEASSIDILQCKQQAL